jgi:hypothetical protein
LALPESTSDLEIDTKFFLHGLSDGMDDSHAGHLFADSNHTSFTVWLSMHSLDFWCVESDLI